MLTIHHLHISQSERIVWLCEELSLPYKLVTHTRDPVAAPESLKSVPGNSTGKAPFVIDEDTHVSLSESNAIVEYILTKYGNGRLVLGSDDSRYGDYLHWLHFANGTLQMMIACAMFIDLVPVSAENRIKQLCDQRLQSALKLMDDRLAGNKWLAGDVFTAADVMTVYCVTTQRYFGPRFSLAEYPGILRWLKDCSEREAYGRAMEKGDPEMRLLLGPEPPEMDMFSAGGTKSDFWKNNR